MELGYTQEDSVLEELGGGGHDTHREHNQRRRLNPFDALIKKAAGDISSHLCPLCVC